MNAFKPLQFPKAPKVEPLPVRIDAGWLGQVLAREDRGIVRMSNHQAPELVI